MTDRWDNLKSKFQGKNIDLDAEFEKFLNELEEFVNSFIVKASTHYATSRSDLPLLYVTSVCTGSIFVANTSDFVTATGRTQLDFMRQVAATKFFCGDNNFCVPVLKSLSDESLASPRHKAPPLKKQSSKDKSSLPWWAEEDEDEEKSREAVRKSWIKPKPKQTDDEHEDNRTSEKQPTQPTPVGISQDSHQGDSTAISMSKDSLEEVTRESFKEKFPGRREGDIEESSIHEEDEDIPTYSDDHIDTSSISTSPMSPGRVKTPDKAPPGLDTLEELVDKERFYRQEGADSQFDYENKLQDITTTDTHSADRDDRLQATGADIGDSIFNATGANQIERAEEDDHNGSDNEEDNDDDDDDDKVEDDASADRGNHGEDNDYSDEFEDTSQNPDVDDNDEVRKDEKTANKPPRPTDAGAKPSLLSKVSLMDSLDSTLDQNKSLPRQQQHTQKADGTARVSGLRATDTGNFGNQYSGTTDTIAELQAALRQVQLNETDTSGLDASDNRKYEQERGQMVIKKTPTGDVESRGFSLKPAVVTDNTPVAGELKPRPFIDSAAFTITSDTIDSASIPVDCRGFDLQPAEQHHPAGLAVDSRGIPLESRVLSLKEHSDVNEGRGFDLKPVADLLNIIDEEVARREGDVEEDDEEDTPPPDSLRSIKEKVKARKSVDNTKQRSSKKDLPGKKTVKESPVRVRGSKEALKKGPKKGTKEPSSSTKSKDHWQPSKSSPPSWSPTPTMRKSRQTESKIPVSKSKTSTNRKDTDDVIVKSVESFANYLKHMVRPDEQDSKSPPTPRWSDDEPTKSRSSVRVTSTEDRLERISREKRLQTEVENWQEAWKEERRRNDKLIADMAARERELSRKDEKTRMVYEEQIHELKQEMYSLQARLKEEQEHADSRKRVASGGNLKGISEEEKKKLEKEIREQEKLMQGYQQENERLYKELKQIQAKAKSTEGRMFAENQKLATEVANLRERLEQTTGQQHYSTTPGSAVLGADRINYLQDQLGSYKKKETQLDKELDDLRRANTTLEQRMRTLERERDNAVERANQALGVGSEEQNELKQRYENDIARLNRKLKWYAENQEMLDRDIVMMKMKDQEIKELKETLEKLRAHQSKAAVERKERTNERASDAKRIRDLERQVREMEEIIKRRYPNSLPALIFAASSAPGIAQPTQDETPQKQSPSYVFLEQQVRKLQKQLEEKDEEGGRLLRALEQKHNAMKLDYEERIKELEKSLERANEKPKAGHPHSSAHALEKELAVVREGDRRRIVDLENEVSVLQEALSRASTLQAHAKNKKRKSDNKKLDTEPETSLRLQALEKQLQEKEKDLSELKETCLKLQQERETMLASPQRQVPITPPRVAELERQNTAFKQRINDITLNADQDRVRYQASLAEAERNTGQAREDAADQIEKLKAQHQREVDQLKSDFAVRHSNSVVTELKSRIASQEIVIQKLRDKVIMESRNAEDLAAAKAREETLKQQLANLQNELYQAKDNFTPEMRHFDALQSKIIAMEQRFNQRESDLERIINNAQIKSRIEKDEADSQWKLLLKKKNQEIERFREELDVILEALRELKRQGVVIPIVGNRF